MKNPFILFSWKDNCMEMLSEYIIEDTKKNDKILSEYTILVPHDRMKRYIEDMFKKNMGFSAPFFLPTMYTLQEYTSSLEYTLLYKEEKPRKILSLHEEILVVQKTIMDSKNAFSSLYKRIISLDNKIQYSWIKKSVSLLNECFLHSVTPKDTTILQDINPLALETINSMYTLYTEYKKVLDAEGYTTPSYTLFRIAECIASLDSTAVRAIEKHTLIPIGFYLFSGSENILMKRLWECVDSRYILYTDTALMSEEAHKSTALQKQWIKDWNAEIILFTRQEKRRTEEPAIMLHQSITIHAELEETAQLLNENTTTAIVPLDSRLVLPLLHYIQKDELNVSIGYPFEYSAVASLLEICLVLHENMLEGLYSKKDILLLLEHSYIKRFIIKDMREERSIYSALEKAVHNMEGEYVEATVVQTLLNRMVDNKEAIDAIFSTCINMPASLKTYKDIAEFLSAISTLIGNETSDTTLSLLETACIERLYTHGIPQFTHSIEYNKEWIQYSIFHALRSYIKSERVPFLGFPITALQIIGLSEIQCIPFEHVILLEALEGNLPHIIEDTPLLPEYIRTHYLGLPSKNVAVMQEAYHFASALSSAKKVDILYHIAKNSSIGSTSVVSRFVEEYIWEWEKKHQKRINETDSIHYIPLAETRPLVYSEGVEKTDYMREAIKKRLDEGISASLLESYLTCPFYFFQSAILAIPKKDELEDDILPVDLGKSIHSVLEKILSPYKGMDTTREMLFEKSSLICANILEDLKKSMLGKTVQQDTMQMLSYTLPKHLNFFIEAHEDEFCIESIEAEYKGSIVSYPLKGTIDRVDVGDNGLDIIDYKSGKPRTYSTKKLYAMLEDTALYSREEYLECIRKAPVQLFVYIYLLYGIENRTDINASFYYLSAESKDTVKKSLFSDKEKNTEVQTKVIEDYIPRTLSIVIEDMIENPLIECIRGKQCSYCAYSSICL